MATLAGSGAAAVSIKSALMGWLVTMNVLGAKSAFHYWFPPWELEALTGVRPSATGPGRGMAPATASASGRGLATAKPAKAAAARTRMFLNCIAAVKGLVYVDYTRCAESIEALVVKSRSECFESESFDLKGERKMEKRGLFMFLSCCSAVHVDFIFACFP